MKRVTVYEAGAVPIRDLRSALHPSRVGVGSFLRLENIRWADDLPVVRDGETAYMDPPVSGATLIDVWAGTLNGTSYVVEAVSISSQIRLYAATPGGTFYEITEVGGFHGEGADESPYGNSGTSRFTTVTARVSFAVCRAPATWIGGSFTKARDVLVIQNGSDRPRIWDPGRSVAATLTVSGVADNGSGLCRVAFTGAHARNTGDTIVISGVVGTTEANGSWTVTRVDSTHVDLQGSAFVTTYDSGGTATKGSHRLSIHHDINVPAGIRSFAQKLTFASYLPVKGSSGKTYASGGVVNQSRFQMINSAGISARVRKPYVGTNQVILIDTHGTDITSGDIATVYFSAASLDMRKGLGILVEDWTNEGCFERLIQRCKIETNIENVVYGSIATSWVTVWDSSSTTGEKKRVTRHSLGGPSDEPPRTMFWFQTDHIAEADRQTVRHFRMTYQSAEDLPDTNEVFILAIVGGGQIPGGSFFSISYEDEPSRRESYSLEVTNTTLASLAEVGGPDNYASAQGDFTIPLSTAVDYDYELIVPNAEGGYFSTPNYVLAGGLNGEPSRANLYLRLPGEATPYYWYSISLWSPGYFGSPFVGLGWLKDNTTTTITHKTSSFATYISYNDRDSFRPAPGPFQTGIPRAAVIASGGSRLFAADVMDEQSQRQPGDVYFSGHAQPFRWQSVVLAEGDGGRVVLGGEIVQAIISSAAQSMGASWVHIFTDRTVGLLGGSGGYAPGTATEDLSLYRRLLNKGTRSPRTVVERDGSIVWLDQMGQVQRLAGGSLAPMVSRTYVDDQTRGIPASLIVQAGSAYWGDHLHLAYADADAVANSQVLVYHDPRAVWESVDIPTPAPHRLFTLGSSGYDTLLLFEADGTVWTYGTDTSADLALAIGTGDLGDRTSDKAIILDSVDVVTDPVDEGTLTVTRDYWPEGGQYTTELELDTGRATDRDSLHEEVVAQADGELGRSGRLTLSGILPAGTRLYTIAAVLDELSSDENRATGVDE